MRRDDIDDREFEYAAMKWFEMADAALDIIWRDWVAAKKRPKNKRGIQPWAVVSKSKLIRVWKSFAEHGFVRDEAALDDIAYDLVFNAAKLYANTMLMGHTAQTPCDQVTSMDDRLTAAQCEDILDGFEDYCIDPDANQWRISDRIGPISNAAADVLLAQNATEKLMTIDKLLNMVHQRTDLAMSFVEGGKRTLNELSGIKEDAGVS